MKDPSKKEASLKAKAKDSATTATSKTKPSAMDASAILDQDAALAAASAGWLEVPATGYKRANIHHINTGCVGTHAHNATSNNFYAVLPDEADDEVNVDNDCTFGRGDMTAGTHSRHTPSPTSADEVLQMSPNVGLGGLDGSLESAAGNRHVTIGSTEQFTGSRFYSHVSNATIHAATVTHGEKMSRNTWLLDSGANTYICNNPAWFTTLHSFDLNVTTADSSKSLQVMGGGSVKLTLADTNGDPFILTLARVAFAPGATTNILSMSKLGSASIHGYWTASRITLFDAQGFQIGTA